MTEIQPSLSDIARQDQDIRAWSCLAQDDTAQQPVASGTLAGLHFGVKDVMDVRGMPTRHGAALENVPLARFDAACVAILRAAGAVPIGKTVTAEFAVTAPGPTCNPWNLQHTPGGSSSGSAAAVAAGMVPFALGTQTGGSIIRPAAFNGVVGFKPSFGRVPRTGMHVLCDSLDTIGWFSRDIGLCRRIAEVFMSAAASASHANPAKRDIKMALLPCQDAGPLSEEAFGTLMRAAETLNGQGVDIETVEAGELVGRTLALHEGIMAYEVARGLLPVLQGEPSALRPQSMQAIEKGLAITPDEYGELQVRRLEVQHAWANRLSSFDLILTPSAPGAAPLGHSTTGSSVFNRIWSLLGWPCVHLPTSQNEIGLPLGVQCVGQLNGDIELLALAETLHSELDRRVMTRPA